MGSSSTTAASEDARAAEEEDSGGVARESLTGRPARPSPARAAHDPSHRPERIVVKHERALIVRLERVGSFPVRLRPKLFTRARWRSVRPRTDPSRASRARRTVHLFSHPCARAFRTPRPRWRRRGRPRGRGHHPRARSPRRHPRASRPRPIEGVVHHLHAQIIERARRYLSSRHRRSRASRVARVE